MCARELYCSLIFLLLSLNCGCGQSASIEITKVSELTGVFAGRITELRASSDNANHAVLVASFMRESHEVNSQEYLKSIREVLISWNGESEIILASNSEKYWSAPNESVLAMSNISEGEIYAVISKDDDGQSNAVCQKWGAVDMSQRLNGISLSQTLSGESKVDAFEVNYRTPKMHLLPNGDTLILIRANEAMRLFKISPQGAMRWKRTLMPKVRKKKPLYRPWQYLAASPNGNIAVAFHVNDDERSAFEAIHGLSLPLANDAGNGTAAVIIMDPRGKILKTEFIALSRIEGITWVDSNKVAIVFSVNQNGNEKAAIAIVNAEAGCVDYRSLSIDSGQFKITSILTVSSSKLLIAGAVDFNRVATGSLVSGGKGFVAVYDLGRDRLIGMSKIGSLRDNAVTAMDAFRGRKDEFLLATIEDAPLTHDQGNEQRSKAVLYRVRLK